MFRTSNKIPHLNVNILINLGVVFYGQTAACIVDVSIDKSD
jgi:hypothetical protein